MCFQDKIKHMENSKNLLIEIIEALNFEKVDYIIAGGVAVVLHGVERLTMDLDTAVSLDKKMLKNLLR